MRARAAKAAWLAAAAALGIGCGAGGERSGPGDTAPPRATSSQPAEGKMDVVPNQVAITVRFDEAMDTAVTAATLEGPEGSQALAGRWTADGTRIEWPVVDLQPGAGYRLDLRAFRDAAGNALDPLPYLHDGSLDFATQGDEDFAPPYAVASDPVEGDGAVDPLLEHIAITFSEPMNASVTEVPLQLDDAPAELVSGTWSESATVLSIALADYLEPGAAVRLDLTGLTDRAGNALHPSHSYLEDGALDFSIHAADGFDCSDPLIPTQADAGFGYHTYHLPAGGDPGFDGPPGCAPEVPDRVLRYDKLSDTVDNGGELLHVSTFTPEQELTIAVTSGACEGTLERCVPVRSHGELYVDVPPGSYWIWIAGEDDDGHFPGAVVSVGEIPAASAEGEGCFAPYTTASRSYTPPAGPSDPHLWTLPASVHAFDQSAVYGTFGCLFPGFGYPDAVIEIHKVEPDTALLVEVESQIPSLYPQLEVHVLSGCDPDAPTTTAHQCRSAARAHGFAAVPPAGPTYVWVSGDKYSQGFPGAVVKMREIAVAPGETRVTPEPLLGSGAIHPTSTLGIEPPSCFSASNVHWYSYTVNGDLVAVKADVPGAIAILGPDGRELGCTTDASQSAFGRRVKSGDTVLIAVESPSAIGNLAIIDDTYAGILGSSNDLGITFSSWVNADYLVAGSNTFALGSNDGIWSFPKAGHAAAVLHGSSQGIGNEQTGTDAAFAMGMLFTVDGFATDTESHVWRVFDETASTWAPVAWDPPGNFPPGTRILAITFDGTELLLASFSTSPAEGVQLFALDPSAPSAPVLLATNTSVHSVRALAADATYFYVAGSNVAGPGIFRIARSNPSAPAQRLASLSFASLQLVADDLGTAGHLYFDRSGHLHAIVGPAAPVPVDIGEVSSSQIPSIDAMAMDVASKTLFVFAESIFNLAVYAIE